MPSHNHDSSHVHKPNMRQTCQKYIDAGSGKDQFVFEGLLVGHDEFELCGGFAEELTDTLQKTILLAAAVDTELSTLRNECVEVHHVELAIVDDLLQVLTLLLGDVVVECILTGFASERAETDPETVCF